MPAGDSRKEFVLATTGNYFGLPSSDASISNSLDNPTLNSFLDDGNQSVLAVRKKDGKKITFTDKVQLLSLQVYLLRLLFM